MAKKQKSSSNLLEVQNAAKTLFANIRFQSIDKPIKTLLITSSVPDEGKTTCAWYLAQAAATAGNRVLLVEADMRRRSMANMLQLHPEHGLFAVLTGTVRLQDAMVPTSVANLYFVDSEPSIPNPPDVLASKRMALMNDMVSQEFDYIIYDTPPVGTFVDAAVLSTVVDGVVLAVRPGGPKRTELQLAYSQLESAGANIIGLCTTFVEGTGSEYYYSYYTKGDRTKRSSGKKVDIVVDSNEAAAAPSISLDADLQVNGVPVKAEAPAQRGAHSQAPASAGTAKSASQAEYSYANVSRNAASGSGISVPRVVPNSNAAGKAKVGYSASPDGSVKVKR